MLRSLKFYSLIAFMALMAVYVLFTWRDSPRTLKQTRTLQIEDDTIARRLAEKVRVLCWIMTGPENHKKKAVHVKNTWGQRCNILLFMSTAEDAELPTVALPIPEGRDHLWVKTREAFRYIWQNYRDQADWFMKADDDTSVSPSPVFYSLLHHKTEIVFSRYFGLTDQLLPIAR